MRWSRGPTSWLVAKASARSSISLADSQSHLPWAADMTNHPLRRRDGPIRGNQNGGAETGAPPSPSGLWTGTAVWTTAMAPAGVIRLGALTTIAA